MAQGAQDEPAMYARCCSVWSHTHWMRAGAHEAARRGAVETAACRAAATGEEIMAELQVAWSLRPTGFADPQEGRGQLLLEEVFRERVQMVTQGV